MRSNRRIEIRTIREWLERDGYRINPNPDDGELHAALESLIDRLGEIHVYLKYTDHLSDRALYELIVHADWLGAHMTPLAHNPVIIPAIDFDSQEYVRYYAIEAERARWHARFRDRTLPAREEPPFDRRNSAGAAAGRLALRRST